MSKRLFVTGGAGSIGSADDRRLVEKSKHKVLVLNGLAYAGNLAAVAGNTRYKFEQVDIVDTAALRPICEEHSPDVVMHLAAESHVDRSIDGPAEIIQTNIDGTFSLLETALSHWRALPSFRKADFRFHHISTDEVFGSLAGTGYFCEETARRLSRRAAGHRFLSRNSAKGFLCSLSHRLRSTR
jgi:dTDP-glucose 4,6-dehydratase